MSKITPTPSVANAITTEQAEPAKVVVESKTATQATTEIATTTKPVATASANKITPKKVVKAATVIAKPAKVEKAPKLKMERDSFTMPKVEYAQFSILKERLIKLGQPAKKSELLRAGIMQLSAMTDAALKAAMIKVPAIKTGRPNKK